MTEPTEPDVSQPRTLTMVPQIVSAMHYTDTSQFPAFRDMLNAWLFRPNVWLNEDTNEITWYGGSYRLPLTWWLVNGNTISSSEFIQTAYRPAPEWSGADLDYFAQNPAEV